MKTVNSSNDIAMHNLLTPLVQFGHNGKSSIAVEITPRINHAHICSGTSAEAFHSGTSFGTNLLSYVTTGVSGFTNNT